MADKKVSRIKKIPLMFVIFAVVWPFLLLLLFMGADAKEEDPVEKIIILLDCSQSMKNVDNRFLIADFIAEAVAIAPENIQIGVVAYDEEIRFSFLPGSSYEEIESTLRNMEYSHYGNAGEGLAEAIDLLKGDDADKKIIMISDGEIMMKTEQQTAESVEKFAHAAEEAAEKNITVDIIALGERIEGNNTVYSAAYKTNGQIYDFADSEELGDFIENRLLDEWEIKRSHVGTMNGSSGELSVYLPDCCMEQATIYLLGRQNNENLTVNCKADKINLLKGRNYTMIEILKPESEEVRIQMTSEETMDVNAYLTAEYQLDLTAEHRYRPESGMTEIRLMIKNPAGQNLLDGHLNDSRLKVYLDNTEQDYTISDGEIWLEEHIEQNVTVRLSIVPDGLFGNYQGSMAVEETVIIPEPEAVPEEEPEQIDWFFWIVIGIFFIALIVVFYLYMRNKEGRTVKKVIDESRIMPKESGIRGNDFCGKIVVYIIHSKDDIDYPPESINLFARCNREMITLEWILDTCNLPIRLSGAEKVVIKPGADKSLIIKNNSKGTALMGRELLMKGRSYHLYYHEKVTFIFDQEDTEIEVHYKDLKPNER